MKLNLDERDVIRLALARLAEDFPTPEGLMTRSQMLEVLDRVAHEHPDSEFRGHKVRIK